LAVSVVCALTAAVFWGLNFTAIYPVLKILGNDQNLQDWVGEQINTVDRRIDGDPAKGTEGLAAKAEGFSKELKKVEEWPDSDLKDKQKRGLTSALARAENQLQAARWELWRWQVTKKYADAYLPTDRFMTLAEIIGLVFVAVLIKGVFEFGQETL